LKGKSEAIVSEEEYLDDDFGGSSNNRSLEYKKPEVKKSQ
jgi:hypothetical protein